MPHPSAFTLVAMLTATSLSDRVMVHPARTHQRALERSTLGTAGALQTAYLAGGCFWGVEAVFEHLRGVTDVVSGYSGGAGPTNYLAVSSGETGHAETVRITFDPGQVTYGQILRVFFSVAHDPTQLNRQGPDIGSQYRSAIFTVNAEQEREARATIAQLTKGGVYKQQIVTQVEPARQFHVAEEVHQDFAARNPQHPYIVYHDLPKIARLKHQFPDLFREPVSAGAVR